ncbi:MAG: hypothetical protein L0I93_08130, partial [Atopostipes suicloacalis]|nr:hypothetical protein [Atopostipes suicloacalis]
MTGKAYTVADEQKNLERFLKKEKIEFNSNYYLRMEKGPKPIYYKMISFAAQIRFSVVEFYYLVFTE